MQLGPKIVATAPPLGASISNNVAAVGQPTVVDSPALMASMMARSRPLKTMRTSVVRAIGDPAAPLLQACQVGDNRPLPRASGQCCCIHASMGLTLHPKPAVQPLIAAGSDSLTHMPLSGPRSSPPPNTRHTSSYIVGQASPGSSMSVCISRLCPAVHRLRSTGRRCRRRQSGEILSSLTTNDHFLAIQLHCLVL